MAKKISKGLAYIITLYTITSLVGLHKTVISLDSDIQNMKVLAPEKSLVGSFL